MVQNKFLRQPTQPIKVCPEKKISQLTNEMLATGFQGRKLAETVEVWYRMLKEKEITIFMGLSGAMVPAGMRKIISYLIRNRAIDVLVSTGANLFHDVHEAIGGKHWLGSATVDDLELFKHRIDRFYDVFAAEMEFRNTDKFVAEFIKNLDENTVYSSREFFYLLGNELIKNDFKDSIVCDAAKNKIPIFCPALCDSSIGYSFVMARRQWGKTIIVDQMKDVDEITKIVEKSKMTGVVYIGGGVPKNFIQQTEMINSILGLNSPGHEYAIQITTDSPQWGGLSGCTFEEAQSWGKISGTAKKVTCYSDATIALPIISHALSERFKQLTRNVPLFHFADDDLEIEYKKVKL